MTLSTEDAERLIAEADRIATEVLTPYNYPDGPLTHAHRENLKRRDSLHAGHASTLAHSVKKLALLLRSTLADLAKEREARINAEMSWRDADKAMVDQTIQAEAALVAERGKVIEECVHVVMALPYATSLTKPGERIERSNTIAAIRALAGKTEGG